MAKKRFSKKSDFSGICFAPLMDDGPATIIELRVLEKHKKFEIIRVAQVAIEYAIAGKYQRAY